MADMDFGVGS